MTDDLDFFEALNGRRFRLVGMENPTLMKVWERPVRRNNWEDGITEYFGGLDVRSVDMETLKKIKVWDELSPEVQKEITEGLTQKTQAVHELMDKARKGRRKKYVNVPTEIECITCHTKVSIPPRIVVQKFEKMAETKKPLLFTLNDYVAQYECSKCKPPVRGKKANPAFANLPKELICKCGTRVKLNVYQLKKKAEKNNTTMEELIKNFSCQVCSPSKGRPKKTKEEKADLIKASDIRKSTKKAAKLAKRVEKAKQKVIKDGQPKRGRGRPKKT